MNSTAYQTQRLLIAEVGTPLSVTMCEDPACDVMPDPEAPEYIKARAYHYHAEEV